MKLIKLTDTDGFTRNNTKWGNNVTHFIFNPSSNPRLCSGDVIHAYRDIFDALLYNKQDANFDNPKYYLAEGDIVIEDSHKMGCYKLTTIKEISLPKWTLKKNNIFKLYAIYWAEAVLHIFEEKYPDDNRPRKAIEAAKEYLRHPTEENKQAADAAAYAADAADAAYAAYAACAANAAANAAYAAADAAYWAKKAAYWAKKADPNLDTDALKKRAIRNGSRRK